MSQEQALSAKLDNSIKVSIPQTILSLLDQLEARWKPDEHRQSVKTVSPASPLTGPWLICPVPGESQRDDNHLFKLIVQDKPKRNWTIEVTDTNDWSVRNHASGFHANLKYNGQTFSGREFFEHRERRSKEK